MNHQDEMTTRRLGRPESRPDGPDEMTVRLPAASGTDQSWTSVPLAGDDSEPRPVKASPDLATVRTAERGAAPVDPRSAYARATLVRFGPGVPRPGTAAAVAAWHGTAAADRSAAPPAARARRRRAPSYLLAVLVLLAVVAFLLWQRMTPALAVDSVSVSAGPGTLACDSTEEVLATVRTNGGAGILRYHWRRSDGTDSGPLRQTVTPGRNQVRLPLRWTFRGHGTYRATASLSVEAPASLSSSVSFTYSCR